MYLKPSDQPFYSNLSTWSLEDPRFSSKKIDYNKLGGFTILIKASENRTSGEVWLGRGYTSL